MEWDLETFLCLVDVVYHLLCGTISQQVLVNKSYSSKIMATTKLDS